MFRTGLTVLFYLERMIIKTALIAKNIEKAKLKRRSLLSFFLVSLLITLLLAACGSEDAVVTTTTQPPQVGGSIALPALPSAPSPTPAPSIKATVTALNLPGLPGVTPTPPLTQSAPAATSGPPATSSARVNPAPGSVAPIAPAPSSPFAGAISNPVSYPKPSQDIPLDGEPKAVEFKGEGKVTEAQFFSKLLNKSLSYQIYLPQEYAASSKRYPVLYMLHGFSGDTNEWNLYGLMSRFDELITTGKSKSYIIVLPLGEQAYWVDWPNNGPRWGEYMAREVVDHIDGNYRTIPLKESRAIGGLSMGANGALQVAMSYPNVFGVVGAHSPTMRTYEQRLPWWGNRDWYARYDPVTMAKSSSYLAEIKLWVDIGQDDKVWRARALELKQVLTGRKLNVKWTDFPGDHDGNYWSAHILDYLSWYASNLVFD